MAVIKKVLHVLLAAAVFLVPAHSRAYDALVAFGDSDTDTGNLPSTPPEYWNKRFSNGPVWVEYLAQRLGLTYNPGANFAVSGHEATDLGTQIAKFWGPGSARDVLYVIWAGSNDMLNHIGSNGTRDSLWDQQIQSVVSSITTACDLLYQKGARKILLLNIPDLTRAPSMTGRYSTSFRNYLRGKIVLCNSRLANALPGVRSSHPGLEIYLEDAYGNMNYLMDHASELGFINTTVGALNDPRLEDKSFTGPGANYVFWDQDHYTTKVHGLLGQWAAQNLPSAPSPTPTISLTAPANNATYVAPATVTLSAAVQANGTTVNAVEFLNGGTLIGKVSSAPYTFNWSGVSPGAYTLSARAIYGSGQSVSSSSVQINVSAPSGNPLPAPWAHSDIGVVGRGGNAYMAADDSIIVTASGQDIWGATDEFHYVWQTVSGDCTVIARVTGVQNTDGYAKAGVMLRAGTNDSAPNVFQFLTPGFGTGFQSRTTSTTTYTPGTNVAAPYWVKIEREGSTFRGYSSPDGINWRMEGSTTMAMANPILAGLAVTSHNDALVNTSTFREVTVRTISAPPDPTPARLSALRLSDGSIRLTLYGTAGAAYLSEFSTDLTEWLPLSTNTPLNGISIIYDPGAKSSPQRYYRATAHR